MPSLEKIRQFEKSLVSLGSEPEVLAERGEEIEDVAPPGESISADLHDLLAPPEGAPSGGPPPAAAEEGFPEAGGESLDELDLSAFGITDEALAEEASGGPDVVQTPAASKEEAPSVPEGVSEREAAPEEPVEEPGEEFALPEGLYETPPEGEPEETPPTEEGFELPDFDLGMAGEAAGAGGTEPPGSEAEEAADFDLPEGLFEEPRAEPEAPEAEAPASDEEAFALPEGPAAPFELPELPDEGALPETLIEAGEAELPQGLPEELSATPGEAAEREQPDYELPEMGPEQITEADEEISFDEGESARAAAAPQEEQFALPGEEETEQPEPGAEEAAEEDFVIDEFSLPGVNEAEAEAEEPARPPAAAEGPVTAEMPPAAAYETEGARAEYTEEEFEALREALAGLPLNLRVAVEEQIGGRKLSGDALRRIIDLLIDGGSASEIARALAYATGVRVSLPRHLEKGTGLAFERERGSVGYVLRKAIVPALQGLVPAAGLLVGLALAANEVIVKPLQAARGYRNAVAQIEAAQYLAAAQSFNSATERHPILNWFHRAADAYRAKGEYQRAADIYERLLLGKSLLGKDPKLLSAEERKRETRTRRRMRLRPFDRRAVLAYASMRTYETLEYDKAEALLKSFLEQTANLGDYQARLALGDNYLEWGSEQPAKYEEAAAAYRKAMRDQKRATDEPVMRILRYYARTGNVEQTEKLVRGFEAKKRPRIDPQIYAEAAGTLIDGERIDLARRALGRAYDVNSGLPETSYQYSRLFRWTADENNEERALNMTLDSYAARQKVTARQRRQAILARNALGELDYRRNEPVKAQGHYTLAIEALERELNQKTLKPTEDLARVYANSADVHYYYDRDLAGALRLYEKARERGLSSEDLLYKIGYIHYDRDETQLAVVEFHRVAQAKRDNPSALYALANTLYLRGDYLAAQGYYNVLIRQLESRRQRIPVLQPQDNAQHRDLLDLTMRTFNNLGVAEKKISEDSRAARRESRAVFYLQRSIEFHDQLTRSPDSLTRTEARNLAFINSRAILYPQPGTELQIYREIPKDLENTRF